MERELFRLLDNDMLFSGIPVNHVEHPPEYCNRRGCLSSSEGLHEDLQTGEGSRGEVLGSVTCTLLREQRQEVTMRMR